MGTSAPATPPAAGQAAPATPAAQPAAAGQGQAGQAQQPGGGFNWGLFPDVPEGQRELLQPHLTNVLGHVTKMEQQYAPYKGITEAVPPDQVQNVLQFLQNYSTDPVATWMGLAQSLQEDGAISNPDFSVEQLQNMIQGPPAEAAQMPGQEEMPPWAQQMAQQLQQMTQAEQMREQQAQQQQVQMEEKQQQQM